MRRNALAARVGIATLLVGLAVPATAAAQDAPVEEPVQVVDDMQDGVAQGTDADGNPVGWTTFQDADPGTSIAIETVPDDTRPDAPADNAVLAVTGSVVQFAGTTHAFSTDALDAWVAQDWSGFAGLSLWVEGTGSDTGLFIDVLDNRNEGSTTDDAERWTVSFVDDFTGWQQLSWTWDEFARKGVGNGAPDDGFNLTEVHGYAFGATTTSGAEVTWHVDDVAVFGERPLAVAFEAPIIITTENAGTVDVGIELTRPADEDVELVVGSSSSTDRTSSEDLIATPSRDYVPFEVPALIPAGETSTTVTVELHDDDDIEVDETIPLRLVVQSGAPDPGPAGRASVSIVDDETEDPLLLEDFEELHAPALLFGDNAQIDVATIEAGDALALPDQDAFDDVLSIEGGGGGGTAGHALPLAEDWSDSTGLQMWLFGTGDGSELTLRVRDNAAADPGPDGWELAWSDEFDAAAGTPADDDDWTYETGGWGWGNQELQYYNDSTDSAAHDGDGNLVITTREVDDPEGAGLPCWYGDCTHTSARLITEGKQEFAYGRMEASVRTGDGTGIWPAFWSLGNDFRDVGWPQTGEIDMMEYVGRIPGEIFGTIHGPGYSGGQSFSSGQILVDPAPPEDFLEYAVVWQPGLIEWEVTDGAGTRTYHEAVPADVAPNEWVFEHPFTLLLNVALGGNFGGALGDDLDLPQETHVDWVRVWQAPDTAERFEATIVDDVEGWRQVTVPWEAFARSADQPAGAPDDGLTLTEAHGWELSVPGEAVRYVDDLRLAAVPCSEDPEVTNADDAGEGSLRDALESACEGATITVDAGLADTTVTLTSGELVAGSDVTVDATAATAFTVSADSASRVLRVEPEATVVLNGVSMVDGAGPGRGGGVLNDGDLTITDARVANNTETDAGGPGFDAGGGGIFTGEDASLTLQRVTVADNATTSHPGGGLFGFFGSTLTIEDSTISGNTAADVAGGIRTLGTLTMRDSTISGNTSTAWHGGGIFATDGTTSLTNVTVGANMAPEGTAGGIVVASFGDTGATVEMVNTLVVANTAGGALDCSVVQNGAGAAALVSNGGNLDSDGSCNLVEDTDLPGTDPLVGPLADNGGPTLTHLPADDSPAVDAAIDDAADDADQRGVARDDDAADIGAVEVAGPAGPRDSDGDGVADELELAAGSDPDDPDSVPQCGGRDYTILGTLDADVLVGTDGQDVIVSLDGADVVLGNRGADRICAGRGRDTVFAGYGRDLVEGGPGRDVLAGAFGSDVIDGGPGADVLLGGLGRDTLLGGRGDDQMFGGRMTDLLLGGPGDDLADGGNGPDTCAAETLVSCERVLG